MKKNFKTMAVVGIVVGCVTVVSVGVLAHANGNAYQDFRNAALHTMRERNMTISSDITVLQNGEVLVTSETLLQRDGRNQYSSSLTQVNGETLEKERASSEAGRITRVGDEFTSVSFEGRRSRERQRENHNPSPSEVRLTEMFADILVGDIRTHFTRSGDTISVNLEGAQIPEILNMAASAAMERSEARPDRAHHEGNHFGDVFKTMPINSDVQIRRIGVETELNGRLLGDSTFTLLVTGMDSDGNLQEIEMIFNASFSDIGGTTPNTIDTAGRIVTEVPLSDSRRRH